MFKRKLSALEYVNADSFNVNGEYNPTIHGTMNIGLF